MIGMGVKGWGWGLVIAGRCRAPPSINDKTIKTKTGNLKNEYIKTATLETLFKKSAF